MGRTSTRAAEVEETVTTGTREISKVSADFGREDLNLLADKINELVDIVNSL